MKKLLTVLLSATCYLTSFTQIDFSNPSWKSECDTLTNLREKNICIFEKYKTADSVLNLSYDNLIKYVDLNLYRAQESTKDTSDIARKEYLEKLSVQRLAIIKSRTDFNELLNGMIDIMAYQFKGEASAGTIVYKYALELTLNQIILVNMLKDRIISGITVHNSN
jgi:uncharacterized protein YecT (DUF1311 family)